MKNAADRLDDSVLGDLIGAACIVVIVYVGLFIAAVLS